MNRIFKVVFNRERGTSMVVNEATGSTQVGKKAAITVAVSGVLMALAGSVNAANVPSSNSYFSFDGKNIVGEASGMDVSLHDGKISIKGDASKLDKKGYGIFTNFHVTDTNPNDHLYAFGVTVSDSDIQNAKSSNRGGAMTLWHNGNEEKQVVNKVIASKFANNSATNEGGAISFSAYGSFNNLGKAEISDSTFQGNSAKHGGAISTEAVALTINNSNFTANKATGWGGAIHVTNVAANASLVVKNSTFVDNQASLVGGAIGLPTGEGTTSTFIENSIFKNNHAIDGGAIGNYGALEVTGSLFEGNTAQLAYDEETKSWTKPVKDDTAIGGGAISLGAVSSTKAATITSTTFKNNVSGKNGGAIATRLGAHANNSGAKLEISATFIGNEAKLDGGAFYNTFYAGEGVKVSGVFTDNLAGNNGGAIYNDGAVDKAGNAGGVMVLSDSHFSGNKAGELGGAIYNSGTLTLSGNNVFENNTDKNGLNDIYNAGTLKVTSGTTTLNSGLNGTDNSKVDLAKEATLAVGGQTSIAMLSGEEGATLSVLSTDVEVKKNEIQNLKLTASGDVNDKLKGDAQALTDMIGKGENGSIGLVQMAQGDVIGAITMDKDGNITEATNTKTVAVAETVSLMPSVVTRVMMNDLRKRMGDVRASEDQYGAWARYNGGELSGQHIDSDFHMIQVGFDTKAISDSIRLGAAFSYAKVDSDAEVNSKSDNYSLAAYGIWTGDNGQFVDIIGRIASIKTDLDDIKDNTSDMSNKAASLSGEFGWRFDLTESVYVEPSVEATYTYMDGDSFKLGNAQYKADSVDSLIGRAGFAAGFKCPANKGDVYVRGAVVHEFLGDTDLSVNSGLRTYSMDGQDTWFEYAIGANVNLNKSTYVYADVERTSGAEMDEDWRANIGVRYSF